jgi:RNA-directed DNA polymerase
VGPLPSDTDLRQTFLGLRTFEDLARLLVIPPQSLVFHIYVAPAASRYAEFDIPKRSGGSRTIRAPITALKLIQRRLATVLLAVYEPRAPVHGFCLNRSIMTNAGMHKHKRYVLNVDLVDFFPSVNFGRVRGMFASPPYSLPLNIATVLAQICCHKNELPQGAPSSPVVSNMICSKMDSQLRRLAMNSRCTYSRYADDLTFSSTVPRFPGNLATITPSGSVELGDALVEVITANGFTPNPNKLRLQSRHQRQEVTGLTVNLFPNVPRRYIHQVRAMLNDWRHHGIEQAQARHIQYSSRRRDATNGLYFHKVVKGKIDFLGMVKGRNDPNYRRFLYEYSRLDPTFVLPEQPLSPPPTNARQAAVYTTGKTDWRHLKAALTRFQARGRFTRVSLVFSEDEADIGDPKLLSMCKAFSSTPTRHPIPQVFIFDRDDPRILADAGLATTDLYDWGMNVFSLVLPIPAHRTTQDGICIELLYVNEDLTRKDDQHRRLFLSSEFHPDSGRHLNLDFNYRYPAKLRPGRLTIIDNDVFDSKHRNVALPKILFAQNVLEATPGYADVDITGFDPLFSLLEAVLYGEVPFARPTTR